jgi:hypothetical protein
MAILILEILDRLALKFVVTDIIDESNNIRREFINTAHILRLYVSDNNIYIELINGCILKSTANNLDSFMEKFYP